MKRPQNKIAESGMTLPLAAAFGLAVWLLSGLTTQQLWLQFACQVLSVYLLIEMSNQNALLRVRSRMVSATFILITSAASFLFPSLTGAVVQLSFIVAFLLLFQTYQDPLALGRVFYAFVAVGVGSLAYVHVLWYVPVLWVLMATQLQSLSWRSAAASLIGLATPYWFALIWLMTPLPHPEQWSPDLQPLAQHFSQLALLRLQAPTFGLHYYIVFALTAVLAATGMVHFWNYGFEDKIRIRLLYGFFATLTIITLLFVALQPQHYDVLMRVAFICASPLIAHVATFTSSKLSNILFFVALAVILAVTSFVMLNA